MSDLMKPQIEVIRERMNRATPGPWGWFGNTSVNHIYLATQRWGRHLVMQFERWGMQSAQPSFFDRPEPEQVRKSIVSDSTMRKAADIPIYEVAPHARSAKAPEVYRQDIVGLRNADATFIANSRTDVEWLVGEVDRLNAIIEAGVHARAAEGNALRLIGWHCEHRWNTPSEGQHTDWDHQKAKPVRRSNVTGSFSNVQTYRASEYRCAFSKPVYVLVDESESAAS